MGTDTLLFICDPTGRIPASQIYNHIKNRCSDGTFPLASRPNHILLKMRSESENDMEKDSDDDNISKMSLEYCEEKGFEVPYNSTVYLMVTLVKINKCPPFVCVHNGCRYHNEIKGNRYTDLVKDYFKSQVPYEKITVSLFTEYSLNKKNIKDWFELLDALVPKQISLVPEQISLVPPAQQPRGDTLIDK